MIKPTIGRVVHYYPGPNYKGTVPEEKDGVRGPLTALVCHVWSDTMVNLATFDSNGHSHPVTSVDLIQPEWAGAKPDYGYCEWMEYQKGQAAKADAALAKSTDALAALKEATTLLS